MTFMPIAESRETAATDDRLLKAVFRLMFRIFSYDQTRFASVFAGSTHR